MGGAVGAVGAGVGPGARVGLVVDAQVSDASFYNFPTRGAPVLARGYLAHLEVHSLGWCLVLVHWWCLDGAGRCASVHCSWGLVYA